MRTSLQALDHLEAGEAAAAFIPQTVAQRFQTPSNGEKLYTRKHRLGIMGPLQLIIWNPGAQVMYVVKTDVSGKPLKNSRQFVE